MKRLFIIFALLVSSNCMVLANDTIYVANPEWDGFLDTNGNGIIMDILKEVYEKNGYSIHLEIVPYARANLYVKKGQKDILFGLYSMKKRDSLGMALNTFTPKYPYSVESTVAVFKKDRFRNWKGRKSLKGYRVVAIRGYQYDKALPFPVQYHEANSHQQCWDMLKKNRVDFYLDDYLDIFSYLKASSLASLPVRIETVLTDNLYPTFSMTPRGKKLGAIYDREMKRLISEGFIDKLYKLRGFDPPVLKPEK